MLFDISKALSVTCLLTADYICVYNVMKYV